MVYEIGNNGERDIVMVDEVIDEGYAGLPNRLREVAELHWHDITATEYKQWLKHEKFTQVIDLRDAT